MVGIKERKYEIVFLDEDGEESRDISYSEQVYEWKLLALKQNNVTIVSSGLIEEK